MYNLSPEEKAVGKGNFQTVTQFTRRDLLKGVAAGSVLSGAGLGAAYFAYEKVNDPVRVGVIGTGDEGSVLIGAHTPSYVNVVAIADIRPYNIHRAFHGDESSPNALAARPGLLAKYGWKTEDEARKHVKVYDKDYRELLADKDVEGVIIALPLHLHARVAIEAMRAGKHVLTEKLMGHSVHECKEMARVSLETDLLLATGHQRHYSILYDNAVASIRSGLLGQLHHIRAQWHRGNLPKKDSWQQPLPNEAYEKEMAALIAKRDTAKDAASAEAITKQIRQYELRLMDKLVDAKAHDYIEHLLKNDKGDLVYTCSPLEELIRWRLWDRTGGGLMAELGSHQLDASSIFISAMYPEVEGPGGKKERVKVQPLSVNAVGARCVFPYDRDCDDHVYCTYEFPAPGYYEDDDFKKKIVKDPNKKIAVFYSSINGNGFGDYGETVLGTEGTLILEREQEAMLYKSSSTTTSVKVAKKGDAAPTLDTTASGGGAAPAAAGGKSDGGPVSRGYTEEIEHWAWCLRNKSPENLPKCHPKVAMADAIIALTSNLAMKTGGRTEFKSEWFEIESDETPEGEKPSLSKYV